MKTIGSVLAIALAMVSCSGSDSAPIPTPPAGGGGTVTNPTYNADIKSIIDSKCITCHGAGGVQSGNPYQTYAQVSASATAMIGRIKGTTGALMPQGGPKLSDASIALIDKWIANGKPEK